MPDEFAHKVVRRMFENVERRAELNDPAPIHDRDYGGQAQRFFDVVGHEHDCLSGRLMDMPEFGLQRVTGDRVDRGERLVHQQHLGIGRECPRDADALLFATRQLVRVFAAIGLGIEAKQFEQFGDPLAYLCPPPFKEPRHRGDIVLDGPMWKEADRLDRVADPAPQCLGGDPRHVLAADSDRSGINRDQPVDHSEGRRLAATGGAEQYAERLGIDGQRQTVDDAAIAVGFGDLVELDHVAGRRRSTAERVCRIKSAASARKIAGNAPSRTRSTAYWPSPSKTKVPSPPAPISAATTASPIACTVTMRSPASSTGRASGNSTCQKICRDVSPIPRPASMTAASTPASPADVLRTTGSRA